MKVEVRDVRRRFVDHQALAGVSLDFASGELIAIVGESGCGKTTLLRIIAGLETLDEGVVRFGDQVVASRDTALPPEKRGIGFVFQSLALWPHMTVFKNVAYGLRARGLKTAEIEPRVEDALERVGLGGKGHRYPHELSGGQRQRVSLCRAMVLEPKVLLMDEPLSALDANLRRDTGRDIRRIQTELNLTTLYVTHDMDEAMTLADRVVVMRDGVVVQTGTPRQVYREPAEPFVAEFTGEINWLRQITPRLDASKGVVLVNQNEAAVGSAMVADDVDWSRDDRLRIGIRPENVVFVEAGTAPHPGRLRISGVVTDVVPGRRVDEVIVDVAGERFVVHGTEKATPTGTAVEFEAPLDRICVYPEEA